MSTTRRALAGIITLLALLSPVSVLAQPVPVLSDSLLDFGEVPFPRFATRDLQIHNAGDAILIVANIFVDNTDKFVDDAFAFNIAPGDSETVTVTYTPVTVGFDSTTVNVVLYIGGFDTLRVAARGRGVPNVPVISLSDDTVSAVVPSGIILTPTLTIANEGGGDLEWTATEIPPTGWLQVFPNAGSLSWTQSINVNFRMESGSNLPGDYYATVQIASNDIDMTPLFVTAHMRIEPSPLISVTPNPVNLGNAFVGNAVSTMISVANVGTGDLHVSDIVSSHAELFLLVDSLTVPQGDDTDLLVQLVPVALGAFSGSLTFFSDDLGTPQYVVPVTANVVPPPVIVMATDTVDVSLPWKANSARKVGIGNTGGSGLSWFVQDFSSADWLSVVPASGMVTPLTTDSVSIGFDAEKNSGVYTTDLTFQSNDPVTPLVQVPTRMTVQPAWLIDAPGTTLVYDPRFVGSVEEQTVTITNAGNIGLDVSSVITTDPNFTLASVPLGLAPQESVDIVVTFAPQSQGVFDAALVIENNSTNNDSIVIPLSGEGLIALDLFVNPDSIALSPGQAGWTTTDVLVGNPSHRRQPVRAAAFDVTSATARAHAAAATTPAPAFYENFEDLEIGGWQIANATSVKEVVPDGANSLFAYRETGSIGGHGRGIYRDLPALVQPKEISFWVKPGQDDKFANYVALRDGAGREVIYFFTLPDGMFYLNASTNGTQTHPYQANVWAFIEFRNMNWTTKTFDYFVDGQLVKAGVGLRNAALVNDIRRIELYSYSAGATAMWDNIWVEWGTAPSWLTLSPVEMELDSLAGQTLQVRVNTAGLEPGEYEAAIALRTNNAITPLLDIPVTLTLDSLVTGVGGGVTPTVSALHQNVPNPFNPVTTIAYDLSDAAEVAIMIYDVTGARVRTLVSRSQPAGRYTATWDGSDDGGRRVASGVYFYRLTAGRFTQTRKMALLK